MLFHGVLKLVVIEIDCLMFSDILIKSPVEDNVFSYNLHNELEFENLRHQVGGRIKSLLFSWTLFRGHELIVGYQYRPSVSSRGSFSKLLLSNILFAQEVKDHVKCFRCNLMQEEIMSNLPDS